jgi:hypothetical protein
MQHQIENYGKIDEEILKSNNKTRLIRKCVIVMIYLYTIYCVVNLVSYLWTLFPDAIAKTHRNKGVCNVIFDNQTIDDITWDVIEVFFNFFV